MYVERVNKNKNRRTDKSGETYTVTTDVKHAYANGTDTMQEKGEHGGNDEERNGKYRMMHGG